MSAGSSGEGDNDEEFDLNLAPIIDCFTVLITYLLVSASFLSLSMLEVSVNEPPSVQVNPEPVSQTKPVSLVLEVISQREILLTLTGPHETTLRIPIDRHSIKDSLNRLKPWTVGLKDISVKAQSQVAYKYVAQVIEWSKEIYPTIFLGD